jgi:nicotinate-nucleotide adenylyltransferase
VKLAILGGSFNPVHLGHLFLADTVLSALNYDRVVFVPAFRSPFKTEAPGMESSGSDRLELIAASVAGDHRITVDGCELTRGGVSYTADTIGDIIARYVPDGKPGLIIGDDLAADFHKWRRYEDILDMADIIVARRVRSGRPDVSFPHTRIDNDVMDISSAAVREKISARAAWRGLVPAAARVIIEERGLYGLPQTGTADGGFEGSPLKSLIVRVEEAARENLSLERFLHSRNAALLARDMCARLGRHLGRHLGPLSATGKGSGKESSLDPEAGYLAGIAHDLGKQLSTPELLWLAEMDGKKITRLEKEKPNLLHGRASAVLLKERFGVCDEAVLGAVALHTNGGENMCPLAKVVYIADKMEFSRENVDLESRRLVYFENNLDKIFFAALNWSIARIKSKKQELSEETVRLLAKMKKLPDIAPQEENV